MHLKSWKYTNVKESYCPLHLVHRISVTVQFSVELGDVIVEEFKDIIFLKFYRVQH